MATKVKPTRLNVTGTPQVGDVPMYVDADSFQWGAGGGSGGDVKLFTLSNSSDLVNAQAAYDYYVAGKNPIIKYDGEFYYLYSVVSNSAIWKVVKDDIGDSSSSSLLQWKSVQLMLSSGTVTSILTNTIGESKYFLRTGKNYTTPYEPEYNGSPATKKYVDDKIVYATQAEYNALLPGALTDGKNYVIYTSDGGGGWQPGVNTLFYYDFENTVGTTETNLAATGSTYDGTYNTTPTFGTLSSGKKYLQCNDNTYVVTSSVPMDFSNLTLFLWGYRPNFSNNNIAFGTSWWGASGPQIVCSNYSSRAYDVCFGESNYPFNNNVLNTTGWHCLVFTNDGTNAKWYLDGNLGDTKTGTNTTVTKDFYIGTLINGSGVIQTSQIFNGYIGCLGFENTAWTATEITDYYNETKGDYGIS